MKAFRVSILVLGILVFFTGFPLTLMLNQPLTKYIAQDVFSTFISGFMTGGAVFAEFVDSS